MAARADDASARLVAGLVGHAARRPYFLARRSYVWTTAASGSTAEPTIPPLTAVLHRKLLLQCRLRSSIQCFDRRVAVLLANRDPESAKTWISSLPSGPVAADAAANFAANHGRFDRAGIESWLSVQPDDSPLRSGLLRGLARLDTALGDPSAAFNHVRQLDPTDPSRSAALRDVFTTWQETEPEQAVRAFGTLSLTAPKSATSSACRQFPDLRGAGGQLLTLDFRPVHAIALLPGDVVVCEHGVQPRQGDVVAALVDGASVLRIWSMRAAGRCSGVPTARPRPSAPGSW